MSWASMYFLLLLFYFKLHEFNCEDASLRIPLNKTISHINRELYGNFVTVEKNSTVTVTLTAISPKIDFIIFQVHTHVYNVTLYNNTMSHGSFVTGKNVGLYGPTRPTPDTYYIFNKNDLDVKMYISVHGYRNFDPIPGGCNMELPTFIAPYIDVTATKDTILLGAPGVQDPKASCPGFINVNFYRLYMPERSFDEDTYFVYLRKMLTLDKIIENGVEIPLTYRKGFGIRRLLSAYQGTGSVYVAVASNDTTLSVESKSIYSIYVPAVSYACSPLDGCVVLDDVTSQFFCACLLFVGLFVCFFGHRFFKTEMFLVGMFGGVILTFTLIPLWAELDRPALLGASIMSGICFGSVWLLLWWFYGIPVLSVVLCTMQLGYIIAAIVYYRSEGFQLLTERNTTFWIIFVMLIVMTSMVLSTVTYLSNIMCCAILGAYAVVFSLDHYMGSNLKYIVINVMRRATVKNFSKAVLTPPFQWRDGIATFLWLTLASLGFAFQHFYNRERAPFPPPPRSISTNIEFMNGYGAVETGAVVRRPISRIEHPEDVAVDERTPLI